ncbi:MAG: hypothetical protein IEMM0002_0235 [bacterium]|nr:MAG: hypothetical protein IEMM0002_0235 [bacterium]
MPVYVGLRIGSKRIRAVVLKTGGREPEVIENIATQAGDDESLAAGLRQCAQLFEKHAASWCVGLPSEEFSFRHLTFPFKKRRVVKSAIAFELEPLLPYPVEEMESSHVISSSSSDETRVLACAINRERLDYYRHALKEADIKAQIITPDACALYSLYKKIGVSNGKLEKLPTVMACVDEDVMLLCYVGEGGFVDYLSTLPDDNEIERFLAAFDEKPEKVFITGAKSADFGLLTTPSDYSWKDSIKKIPGGKLCAEEAVIPLGLALRGMEGTKKVFNFSGDTAHFGKLPKNLRFAAVCAAVILVFGTGFLFFRNHVKSGILSETKLQIHSIFKTALPEVRIVKPAFQLKQQIVEMKKTLKRSGIVGSGRVDILWILKSIAEKMSDDNSTELDEVIYEPGNLTIKGRTEGFESVNKIRDSLANVPVFKNVEVADSHATADGEQVSFKLRVGL